MTVRAGFERLYALLTGKHDVRGSGEAVAPKVVPEFREGPGFLAWLCSEADRQANKRRGRH